MYHFCLPHLPLSSFKKSIFLSIYFVGTVLPNSSSTYFPLPLLSPVPHSLLTSFPLLSHFWHIYVERIELCHWLRYSNAGRVANEISHIPVSTCWRILQNCKFFQSTEFFASEHRLVVAILKPHVKSGRISRFNHTVLHLERLNALVCAHEYTMTVSNWFNVLSTLKDPVELWDTFKCETLQTAKEWIKKWCSLENIEKSRCQGLVM